MYHYLHMNPSEDMLKMLFLYFSYSVLLGNSVGLFLGNLVTGVKTIIQLVPLFFVPFIVLAGFVVNTCNRVSLSATGCLLLPQIYQPIQVYARDHLQGRIQRQPSRHDQC